MMFLGCVKKPARQNTEVEPGTDFNFDPPPMINFQKGVTRHEANGQRQDLKITARDKLTSKFSWLDMDHITNPSTCTPQTLWAAYIH